MTVSVKTLQSFPVDSRVFVKLNSNHHWHWVDVANEGFYAVVVKNPATGGAEGGIVVSGLGKAYLASYTFLGADEDSSVDEIRLATQDELDLLS